MKIGLCGYVIDVQNKYELFTRQCEKYVVDGAPDFTVSCSNEDILLEKEYAEENAINAPEMLESLAIYRKICYLLAKKDIFLMHSAIIEVDGKAIAFLARSGVGKSTHIVNWAKAFKGKVNIVNGDKPLIMKKGGEFYACGTPWAGKENWQRNVIKPLYALCFLSRDSQNSCEETSCDKVVDRLFNQIYLPDGENETGRVLENMNEMLKKVKLFELKCNKEIESAIVAYSKIIGE